MDVNALRIFSRVARLQSFSAAARELSISQSQASRAVADIEAELGALLLARTTRAVVPTEAGAEYLIRVEAVLDQLDDAEQSVRIDELRGTLRVGMPTSAGVREIIPRLPRFTERHPKLRIEILLDDRRQDLVREAVDVAIRIGTLPDSNATARLLTSYARVIVASPAYLADRGTPLSPDELIGHRIVYGPATTVNTAWTFMQDGVTTTVPAEPNIAFSDNEGAVAGAKAGLGITSIGFWTCREEIGDGSLVPILTAWSMAPTKVHAYFPLGRATRTAARAFINFLSDEFSGGFDGPPVR
ncbi:LysR substrate-binding domain-containing protein [Paraburkholderia bryophila]|uniref:LysR family transcriptional regulator n=1 Tax=Paraburkholderia bryophila TaxID=420952 RepID=UPI0023496A8E|nr:LysR family transcriptional regulator [Paraburkholderia bryophila]WCM24156.1 LysR substrate-binding domain-containing protein [Paraburkholderia bryophila]